VPPPPRPNRISRSSLPPEHGTDPDLAGNAQHRTGLPATQMNEAPDRCAAQLGLLACRLRPPVRPPRHPRAHPQRPEHFQVVQTDTTTWAKQTHEIHESTNRGPADVHHSASRRGPLDARSATFSFNWVTQTDRPGPGQRGAITDWFSHSLPRIPNPTQRDSPHGADASIASGWSSIRGRALATGRAPGIPNPGQTRQAR